MAQLIILQCEAVEVPQWVRMETAPVQIRTETSGSRQQLGLRWSQPSLFIKPKFPIPSLALWPQNIDRQQLVSTSKSFEQKRVAHWALKHELFIVSLGGLVL